MQQSSMVAMLLKIQKDLNSVTVCAINANGSIVDVLSLYGDNNTPYMYIPLYASRMSTTLQSLLDALEKLINDTDELVRYIDAKG